MCGPPRSPAPDDQAAGGQAPRRRSTAPGSQGDDVVDRAVAGARLRDAAGRRRRRSSRSSASPAARSPSAAPRACPPRGTGWRWASPPSIHRRSRPGRSDRPRSRAGRGPKRVTTVTVTRPPAPTVTSSTDSTWERSKTGKPRGSRQPIDASSESPRNRRARAAARGSGSRARRQHAQTRLPSRASIPSRYSRAARTTCLSAFRRGAAAARAAAAGSLPSSGGNSAAPAPESHRQPPRLHRRHPRSGRRRRPPRRPRRPAPRTPMHAPCFSDFAPTLPARRNPASLGEIAGRVLSSKPHTLDPWKPLLASPTSRCT